MEKEELERKNREYCEEIERLLKEKNYLDNYLYAEYIVTTFINDDRNFQRGRFYRITRTNRKIFEYCVETVKFLNPSLYKEFLEAERVGQERKIAGMIKNVNIVAEGIKNGRMKDGAKFDILHFYRLIPCRESGADFVNDLKTFLSECDGLVDGAYESITKYMEDNDITEIVFLTENYVLENKALYSSDERVTPEVVHNCFRYMFAMGIPKIDAAFRTVLNRYLSGEISFRNLNKMEKRSRIRKNETKCDNPHKLELKSDYNKDKK